MSWIKTASKSALAAGAILAAYKLNGDRPIAGYRGVYQRMASAIAGDRYTLVWPPAGAARVSTMDSATIGDVPVRNDAVKAVIRPGLSDPDGRIIIRPKVLVG